MKLWQLKYVHGPGKYAGLECKIIASDISSALSAGERLLYEYTKEPNEYPCVYAVAVDHIDGVGP